MLRNIPGSGVRTPGSYDAAELAIDPRGRGGLAAIHKPVYGALWLAGLAQQYQLFDWIDRRNYRFRYEVIEQPGSMAERRIPSEDLFPNSNRSQLLQCYLHDLCWFQIPAERQAEVKKSLMLRLARRYCRQHSPRGSISVYSVVERITAVQARQVERGPFVLFRFRWQAGQVVLEEPAADPLLRMELVEGNPPGEPR
jgi:hypothetical protein